MSQSRTILATVVLVCAVIEMPRAQADPWNRKVDEIAVLPAASGPAGTFDIHAAWSYRVEPTTKQVDLSTEIVAHVNGTQVGSTTTTILVPAGGGASDTTLASPAFGVPLQPGDEIMVLLRPAPGAVPDTNTDDDLSRTPFGGEPIGWNRTLVGFSIASTTSPTALNVPDPSPQPARREVQDAIGNYNFKLEICSVPLNLQSDLVLFVNRVEVSSVRSCIGFVTATDPCPRVCDGASCGTATCDKEIVPLTCKPTEWLGVNLCACTAASIEEVIPIPDAEPGDEIMVLLRPAPGALPELPGLEDDDFSIQILGSEVCMVDVSKTVCDMKAFKGECVVENCTTADGRDCTVLKCSPQFVLGLVLPNQEGCTDASGNVIGPCDCWALPDDTRFVWRPQIKLRIDPSFPGCPYRGIWGKVDGAFSSWFILDTSVSPPRRLATGSGNGALGVGSHREAPECSLEGCESCYVVTPWLDANQQMIGIQIHIEGMLTGEVREKQPSPDIPLCRVQVGMRGEMRIPFDAIGNLAPPTTALPWEAEFTIDGELCCTCQSRVSTSCILE